MAATGNTIHPSLDLSKRNLPDSTEKLLLARKALFADSYGLDTIESRGKWSGGIDGVYVNLRGESVRRDYIGKSITLVAQPGNTSNDAPYTKGKTKDIYLERAILPITLKKVDIISGGTYGAVWNVKGTIECYSRADLHTVETYFLVPGNKIYVKVGHVQGWMEHDYNASSLEIPKGWTRGKNLDFACRIVQYTFGFDQGKWTCTFSAVGIEDIFNNLVIPYTFEDQGYTFFDGKGQREAASGIGQAIYFVDAVGNEGWSLCQGSRNKVIGKPFKKYKFPKSDNAGYIVCFDEKYWEAYHFDRIESNTGGTSDENLQDQIKQKFGLRIYFTLEYVVNRIINDLLLSNALFDKGFVDKSLEDLLKDRKWYLRFPKDEVGVKIKVPPASELPYLSANPGQVILLGRADYTDASGQGVNFDNLVSGVRAVQGDEADIRNILIHGSVIEQAAAQSTTVDEKVQGAKKQRSNQLSIAKFFQHITDIISQCTGGFVSPRLSQDASLDTLNPDTEELPTLVKHQGSVIGVKFKCVNFDPIRGDGNSRNITITSGVGSQSFQMQLLKNATQFGGASIGTALRDEQEQPQKLADNKKEVEESIQTLKNKLGTQKFTKSDVQEAETLFGKLFAIYAPPSSEPKTVDPNRLYLYPALGMDVRLHGISGFKQGNFITATSVPPAYQIGQAESVAAGAGLPFFVMQVSHKIDLDTNDWETELKAQLGFSVGLEVVNLAT